MSSDRYIDRKCQNAGNGHVSHNLNKHVPDLLRLDSIGEVSSAKIKRNSGTKFLRKPQRPDIKRSESNCYTNFVDNLNMGTLIDSASAYIGTATSYFGNLCPYSKPNYLSQSERDKKPLSYLKTLFNRSSGQSGSIMTSACPDLDPVVSWATNTDTCPSVRQNSSTEKPLNWTGNIFGAINNSLLSSCPVKQVEMKTACTEKYLPPQKRYCLQNGFHKSNHVDPVLTPYNAKLLEKSKQEHLNRKTVCGSVLEREKPTCIQGKIVENCILKDESVCDNVKRRDANGNESTVAESYDNADNSHQNISLITAQIDNVCKTNTDLQEQPEDKPHPTDWFEYECKSVKCIPIPEEKIQAATQRCTTENISEDSQGSNSDRQMHSWFSIENGNDCQNTQLQLMCNNSSQSPVTLTPVCRTEEDLQNDNGTPLISTKIDENTRTVCDSNQETVGTEVNVPADSLISVLYVRNLDKKRHCSAKKRRRRKAQQKDSVKMKEENNSSAKRSSCKSDSTTHCGSSIAFILGYDPNDAENGIHSFQVACDINSDSDWTESDCESDEQLSSLDDEHILANELGFQCSDPLNGMNFSLTCMVDPIDPATTCAAANSTIDKINLSWKIHVAVESEPVKECKSKKQVHFAEEKTLATVHPIIAWSHAYQAARKGPWEEFARDRGRFLRRITDSEHLLAPVFQTAHRDKIYAQRFSESGKN